MSKSKNKNKIGPHGFSKIPHGFHKRIREFTESQLKVWLAHRCMEGKAGTSFPGLDAISACTGLNVHTISDARKWLRNHGWLVSQGQTRARGGKFSVPIEHTTVPPLTDSRIPTGGEKTTASRIPTDGTDSRKTASGPTASGPTASGPTASGKPTIEVDPALEVGPASEAEATHTLKYQTETRARVDLPPGKPAHPNPLRDAPPQAVRFFRAVAECRVPRKAKNPDGHIAVQLREMNFALEIEEQFLLDFREQIFARLKAANGSPVTLDWRPFARQFADAVHANALQSFVDSDMLDRIRAELDAYPGISIAGDTITARKESD